MVKVFILHHQASRVYLDGVGHGQVRLNGRSSLSRGR